MTQTEKENSITNLILVMDKLLIGEFLIVELDKPYRRFFISRLSEKNIDNRYPQGLAGGCVKL
jgi:hypothetical protein